MAVERYDQLSSNPWLNVMIYSDSAFVVNWHEVANQDLIKKAVDLDDRLKEEGDVCYVWISREDNKYVDDLCNNLMDDMCDNRQSSSSDDSW
ncbi:hypothetical protein BDV19DRAFT_356779 [Aspergillus venezuelensis]